MERETKKALSWADEVEWEEQQKGRDEGRPDSKPDPFGAARPREVVLEEKGVDWRKIDHESYKQCSTISKLENKRKNISSSASRCQHQSRIQAQNVSPLVPPPRSYLPMNITAVPAQMRSNPHSSASRCIPMSKDSSRKRKWTGQAQSNATRRVLADMSTDGRRMNHHTDAVAREIEWEDVYEMYAARRSNYKDKGKIASIQQSMQKKASR